MSAQEAAMLLVQEGNSPRSQWPLVKSSHVIGRETDSDIQVDDRQVSRRHAAISQTPLGYTIRDLGSKNGTYLNGEPVGDQPVYIRNGDEIGIALCAKMTFIEDDATAPVILASVEKPSLRMDRDARRVWVKEVEVAPPLSLAQYKMLDLLYQNAGKVVSREDVITIVWGDSPEGISEQALDALARRLRERIAEIDEEHKYVETVRGHGFRLNLAEDV